MRLVLILIGLAGWLAVLPLAAIPVRTLAFDLPSATVAFDVKPVDGKEDSAGKLRIEAAKNQFGTTTDLPPGNYVAASGSFKTRAKFTLSDTPGARYLLLILPAKDGTCTIFPIPDDIARIGPGDRFLLNAMNEEIAVRFGTKRSIIKPLHSEYLRPAAGDTGDDRIEVEMARKVKTKWVPFSSTYWPRDRQARSFVLIYPDPANGRPRVKSLAEVPQ